MANGKKALREEVVESEGEEKGKGGRDWQEMGFCFLLLPLRFIFTSAANLFRIAFHRPNASQSMEYRQGQQGPCQRDVQYSLNP